MRGPLLYSVGFAWVPLYSRAVGLVLDGRFLGRQGDHSLGRGQEAKLSPQKPQTDSRSSLNVAVDRVWHCGDMTCSEASLATGNLMAS